MSDAAASAFESLASGRLELGEVTRLVTELEKSSAERRALRFGISSNVTVDLLGTFLRKHAILDDAHALVHVGNFDDHLGNVRGFVEGEIDVLVLLNLFDALIPSFEARLPLLEASLVDEKLEQVRSELGLVLAEARETKYVFVSLLHRLSSPNTEGFADEVDEVIGRFNETIREEARRFDNVRLLSSAAIAARLGWDKTHDLRSYGRFRAPFTTAFLDGFAQAMFRQSRGFGSYFFKALVLDCDNTLWGGILGEDLASGIRLDPNGYPGRVYWQVQHGFLALQRRGVLLCLCTKNNLEDVEELLKTHPDMVLRSEHFVTKRINWNDKVANLREIAEELGIGLDSLIFIDDSPFECEAVRSLLPMVRTLQVPKNVFEYPALVAEVKALFALSAVSAESAAKTEQYRLRAQAIAERNQFASQEEYLASLGLEVTVRCNDTTAIHRVAELTQKSNQFNLTTRRYSEAEIRSLVESETADVYSVHVADKFGDSGLTGVVIVRYDATGLAVLDTFLLSCRILGRGVEQSFWNAIFDRAITHGCRALTAEFFPTAKNAQVRDFWNRLGLDLATEDTTGRRTYRADLTKFRVSSPTHIEVTHVF